MRFILTLAFSIFLGNAFFSNLAAQGIQAENLQCEHLADPLGIDSTQPRLSWGLRAIPSGQRGQSKSAYQILAASSEKLLSEDQGDLWDSGKVVSERCSEIEYEGKPLKSDQWCHWKVRVWDKQGTVSPWSAPAHWSMGILDRREWQGKWLRYVKPIDRQEDAEKNRITLRDSQWIWTAEGDAAKSAPGGVRFFRMTFNLPEKTAVKKAEIMLTADDGFTLYINGKQAGENRRGNDGWRDAQKSDIAQLLVPGRNCVAIEAENGADSPAGVAAKIFITLENGEEIVKTSDASWSASKTGASGWTRADFDGSKWEKAQVSGPMGIAPWGEISLGRSADWMQKAFSPIFRKTFAVKKPLSKATVSLCGLGYYELRVDGKKVGDRVLDPKFTRYDKRALYATYDVTEQLAEGKNAIGIMLGNGFYNVHEKDVWFFEKAPWRDEPTLLFRLKLDYADGTSETIVSDSSWKASAGPVVHDGIRNGEEYDARLEQPGWDTAAFDDSAWAAPQIGEGPKGALHAQTSSPIRVMQTLTPIGVTEPKPGAFVFDMGQNIAGWAQLKVTGPAGAKVTLRYGERLHSDGTLSPEPNDKFVSEGPFQTDRYTLKGQGEEVWEPRFTYHGYRYVEVTGFPGKPTVENLRGRVVHTSFTPAGSFECSNELLNKIQQITLWAYRSNFVGIPTDCPHREKNGWTGDAHLAGEMAMFNFHNIASYEAWMNDARDEQRENGSLPGIVPTGGWGYNMSGPAWESAFILIPWYLYQYTGDTRVLAENYENMKHTVEYFTNCSKDSILEIGLGDWVPAKTVTPTGVTSTGYYYVDALLVSKIANLLGKPAEAKSYAELAEKIRKAFQEKYCKPGGIVANNSQTALSCALYQGLASSEEKKAIAENLAANVKQNGDHLDTGFLGAKYLFRALADNGQEELAFRILAQTTPPSYGDWIARGATTLWEDWVGDESQNHTAFGDVSAWFYQYLAGINLDPAQPAFKHIIIRPRPVGDLKWVKATHETVSGPIAVSWKRDEGTFALDLSVPVNATATIFVPTQNAAGITESGKPASEAPGVKFLRPEGNAAVFHVGSGNYSFQSPFPQSSGNAK